MTENWLKGIEEEIDEQVDKYISVRDYRFYQIGKLKKIGSRLNLYEQKNCVECRHLKRELEDVVGKLNERINGSGAKRREFESKVEGITKHLKEKHQVYPPNYFAYLFAFRYMIGGLIVGLLASYGVFYYFEWRLVLACWGVSLISGYFAGSKKDAFVRQSGKML